MKVIKNILISALSSLLLFSCKADPIGGDEEAPILQIVLPSEDAVFYTSDSALVPNTLRIQAKATDNNAITFGLLTITDANGDLVDADVETNFYDNNTLMELVADFSTDTPGTYTLNFLFRDANDNNSTASRTIVCLAGEEAIDGNEEGSNDIVFQFFASDKKNGTVLRIDIYDDGHSANLIANQVSEAQGMMLYPDQEELLFGTTQNGLDVEIFSAGLNGEHLNKMMVSTSNYRFGTLAKDQNGQEIYYFLESADLTKVPRHVLYKMDGDGNNQAMVAQIDNATSENAIQKIRIYDNFDSPLLVMHDKTTVYVYDPEGEGSWANSGIFSQEGITIHDIVLAGENDKTVYMILKYGDYYNVGTVNLDGSAPNVSFLRIAENHPADPDNLPHRIKVDVANQYIYWFTLSEDLQKSILKRANFNDTHVETLWETSTCTCGGATEEIRIEDYLINTGAIIVPMTN